jgi:hypothetical protein
MMGELSGDCCGRCQGMVVELTLVWAVTMDTSRGERRFGEMTIIFLSIFGVAILASTQRKNQDSKS